jgi:hypothetical protein
MDEEKLRHLVVRAERVLRTDMHTLLSSGSLGACGAFRQSVDLNWARSACMDNRLDTSEDDQATPEHAAGWAKHGGFTVKHRIAAARK